MKLNLTKLAIVENYLSCHVCSETFRDPVSLSCNHSFCSSCLQKFWEQTKNTNCPICKRKSSKDYPSVNFALKELADSFTGRQKSGSSETDKGEKKLTMVCSKHEKESKLFCVDEQRAVCPVCDFSLHQSHKVVPVEEALHFNKTYDLFLGEEMRAGVWQAVNLNVESKFMTLAATTTSVQAANKSSENKLSCDT
uniref:RING-type domain-containing protein n=1 Tax=Maylandia zebra TaxID=106582 RepID=A0A3P9CWJ7_9CICH